MTDLTWMDACAQAELVRSGQASPPELVAAAIERIERVNPRLNAVIHQRFDKAVREAAGPLPDGPFRGVPLLVKDLACQTEGDPFHCGARFLKELGWTADHDSAYITRFRHAGFVIVGRTNVPEFGTTITTEPEAYGPARNPWDPGHSTGGSSGGTGAAVAAGMTPVGHGNDGGGSIRIPASECGVVGLKPTRARVSQAPDVGEAWMGSTIDGVLTRTVRDTAAVLDCIAGAEPGDPYPAPPLTRPLLQEVGVDPGPLRIGILDHPVLPGVPADVEAAEAVAGAARLLESLGHKVEVSHPAALEEPEFQQHFVNIVTVAMATDLETWGRRIGRPVTDEDIEPGNAAFAALGRGVPATAYLASVEWMHGYQRRMARWWAEDGFDILVSPVLNGPPPRLGWLTDPELGMARVIELLQYTAQFNLTGQPAVSLPLHWTEGGLPVGVQLASAFGAEGVLVRMASQLEQAQPWAGRHPPVHA
ncbi:MAG TPA: amidase [Acidimicrobiales bacterium]|nr:amidase [Acidimicrobiales bacterium]